MELKTLELICGGAPSLEAIAMQLRAGKARVSKAAETLVRNGLLKRVNGRFVAVGVAK